jgi:lipid II:glycine glycyltransferase (peptidoglycan interpeptide bridge formation enzyme)
MLSFLASEVGTAGRRSVEVRPRQRETAGDSRSAWPSDEPVPFGASGGPGFSPGAQYVLHSLDLTPPLDQIHARFHPSCVRRPIRRAEREGVTCESGRSGELLAAFYPLVTMARRRHGLPPPPRAWFENLLRCLEDRVTIHVARKAGVAVAGILMLTHRRTVTYKAGGSDGRFHSLGVMPFLFWHAIRDAKQRGIEEMDLGRSDLDQPGLIAFKDHFGARRSTVTYYHYPPGQARVAQDDWKVRAARRVFARLPLPALSLAGRLLYKQFG